MAAKGIRCHIFSRPKEEKMTITLASLKKLMLFIQPAYLPPSPQKHLKTDVSLRV